MTRFSFRRARAAIAAGLALSLGACAAPGFRADVARFQAQLPVPQGQSFAISAADPALAGGIEFGSYAQLVSAELTRLGYRPAAPGETAEMVITMRYGVDQGRERVRTRPSAFHDPFFGSFYHPRFGFYRPGFYRPVVVRGPHGRRFVYGWHDPFLWHGWGSSWGGSDVESFTVYTSGLDVTINRAADGTRLFEGRAEAQSRDNNLAYLVPNLVQAMFTNFPGNSGEKVRITVAPPPRSR